MWTKLPESDVTSYGTVWRKGAGKRRAEIKKAP